MSAVFQVNLCILLLQYLYKWDTDTWEPPAEFYQKFPYYLSGYDDEGRPSKLVFAKLSRINPEKLLTISRILTVWIIELGRWDIKSALNNGSDYKATFDRYVDKLMYRILRSIGEKEFEDIDEPVRQVTLIYDMEGYGIEQLQSLPGMSICLSLTSLLAQFLHDYYKQLQKW